VFFLYRIIRSSSPTVRWALCGLLLAIGVVLIVLGLAGHNTVLAIRGVIELVIVGVIAAALLRPGRAVRGGGDSTGLPGQL
jgi:hypothetical protein